jgi:ATP-dependent RNA helicase DeaD
MNSIETPIGFDQLGLAEPVLRALRELGYEAPTPIQSQCIPPLLEGRDLLGQAQTGTGKTAAFALPLICRIDVQQTIPQVLVLAPTRELALQVAEAFQSYAHNLKGFHVLPLYGGQAYDLQIRQLRRGAQVIVGTPGRVMDHMRRGTLQLDGIRALVLDEADEMLNMGFAEDIEWIFQQAPQERQVALFSATMPPAIRKVAQTHLRDPREIKVESRSETVETIEQQHCVVTRFHKLDVLTRVLELQDFDAMLVFVRTKNATVELAEKLSAHGFAAEALHGDMNQVMRERAVERLKKGKLDIIVATDVAARGLDVERISLVVNYDIPNDPESYVHRIGRTGRAGRKGRALLFVQPRERHLLQAIERAIRQRIPALQPPSADQLTEHRIDRFTDDLRRTLAEQDLDFFHRLVDRIAREQEMQTRDIAAALAYLNQKERPLEVRDETSPRGGKADTRERKPARADDKRPEKARRGEPGGETVPMVCYRIEVGHQDGVKPGEIVGAIANEAGLEGRYIGRIDIQADHSLVDLPEGMPKEIAQVLWRTRVRGKALKLRISDSRGGQGGRPRAEGKPRGKRG